MSKTKNAASTLGRSLSSAAQTVTASGDAAATRALKPTFAKKIKASRSIDMPTLHHEGKSQRALDGNTAAAHVAYAMSDVSFIYPISPSTSMGETVDKFASAGRRNVFGQIVKVRQMQSELGSAGAVHGALSGGALSTTFTASQGLLLMIPNMYLLAGELLPAVFHVSARALARQSLSIFCDHSDIMAARTTGCAMLSAHNPQEVMDLGLVAHLASLKSSVPFVHFFDGTRTSGVVECVSPIPYSQMKSLVPWDAVSAFRSRGLNPQHPIMRGMGQDPQIYYQSAVSANRYYDAVPDIVQSTMDEVSMATGRQYKLFDYYGDPEAERVVVLMGSAAKTAEETVDYLRSQGERVGILKVRLFRPFSTKHFLAEMPESVKAIAVLDRTKEDFASSLPLHADVLTAMSEAGVYKTVVGGNYGLGSKEFAPRHVKAVFDNLQEKVPKRHFTVGINDDVMNSNLPLGEPINCMDEGVTQAIFFGLGSDGTVGANKAAAAIIGERTEFYSQGHFNYSSQKAGASTVSHLRFGPTPIRSEYEIEMGADYVACHHTSFLPKFDMVSKARPGAAFVVNCPWSTIEDLDKQFPAKLRREIAEKQLDLYTIDAHAVATSVGLPAKRINQVMQATFFHLSNILPPEDAKEQLEAAIDRMYGKKSPDIVRANKAALAAAVENLNFVQYPESWLAAEDNEDSLRVGNPSATKYSKDVDDFSAKFLMSIDSRKGDSLPVSAFSPGGETPIGQSLYQKRALAEEVPVWIPDLCTQCNLCSVVCPHAVIRPFLLDKKESETTPAGYQSRKAKGGELGGMNFTIQVAPYDCTGCAVCVEMCPDDALEMKPSQLSRESFNEHWEYSLNVVSLKDTLMDKMTVKGSQFQDPLMEFSGACSGCGETPYVKLLTQMFGDRMVIANSSGCSSVWGGSYGLSPFKKNKDGQGPAWARSLFEDTAEYGLGMSLSSVQRRERLQLSAKELLEDAADSPGLISADLEGLLQKWLDAYEDAEKCSAMQPAIKRLLAAEDGPDASPLLKEVRRSEDMIVAPSHWIIGGDGWAYDIGFGGLDHVLASGQNINILVLDTEGYSNTGAQISKATPKGAIMKMASGGNPAKKKDLGAIAMMHENSYVASVSLSADVNQTIKAFREAEAYNGPSIIIAYATCVDWGHRHGDKAMVLQQVQAVESGYWPMYRYNPDKVGGDSNGFELDNKRISGKVMEDFLAHENRFTSLRRSAPEYAKLLQSAMVEGAESRHEVRRRKAMADEDLLEYLKKSMGEQVTGDRVTVLYGTDTGNAEIVAKNFQFEMKRRGMKAKCMALNDFAVSDLADESKVLAIVSTAGQGDMPKSAVKFWEEMESFLETAPPDFMKDTKFAVFGLGDSSYVFFNEAAKKVDEAFAKLGGQRVHELGLGDDQHDGRFDTVLEEWSPDYYDNIEAPAPPDEMAPPSHLVEILPPEHAKFKLAAEPFVPHGSKEVRMSIKRSTVPEGYERAIDHFEFDLSGSSLSYSQGDSLGVWPSNEKEQVDICLASLGLQGDEALHLQPVDSNRSVPLPEVITARALFTEVLDIGGWPKRRFYEMLKLSAADPAEKEQLARLCSKDGKAEYKDYVDESYTYAELLQKFPSAKPSIGNLLDYVPDIKPRLYSIASSSRLRGDDECHLCIIKNEWTAKSGRDRVGLSTRWLSELEPGTEGLKVHSCVHPSAVTMPDTHKTPLLMVALGTGIAPMRAFIEERAAAKKDGEECGPMALFFGARNRAEYSYESEFEQYHKEGLLDHIVLALSREQKEKIYVTHRLQQEKQMVYDLIHEKEGNLYLCGPGGSVPPQVRKAVIDAIRDCGGHSQEYAEKYVEQMQINGRYNVEAW